MMRTRSLLYLIGALVVIDVPFFLTGLYLFFKTPSEHPEIILQQNFIQAALLPTASPKQWKREDEAAQQYKSKFEGLDFQDLLAKIKGTIGKNLQVRITRDKRTKKPLVTLNYSELTFLKVINVSKAKGENPSKKYAFVHYLYNDQLSKNTRAFFSLCAQAGQSGRKVVRPLVRQTKLGSDDSWLLLETYYDVKYLDSLLAATGYAALIDKAEYVNECPPNSPNHVSIHFIDNSKASMDFTKVNFRLQENYYKTIAKNTTQKGWTECGFLDRAMKRTPGKQFCVNGDIIKDWKVLEKDIIKNEKCLNIYQWRGIDGVTYRLKFSEDNLKFSSIDLTYALRPGQPVMREVERFGKEFLPENYIAVYVRSEFMLRGRSIDYLRKCVDLVLEVLVALKTTTGLSHVYVATDMGDYGSSWLVRYRSKEHLDENVFKDIHDHIVTKSKGVAYSPPSDELDRGVAALVDMTLISRARYLLSAGTGTFQQWVAARFLENHRNDKQLWSKITVCT